MEKWLGGIGWDCPVCEGEGEIWPDEPEEDESEDDESDSEREDDTLDTIPVDEQLLTCPHCGGTGKTRKPIEKNEKAA